MADYRVRFVGDTGNLASFSQSIRGAFSQIRSGYQSSAASPITSLKAPNLSTGNITTQIDAYNRTLTNSGQVFHRYVSGWTADLQRLAVAERRLGAGGTAITNPKVSTGYSSLGTSLSKTGKATVTAKDLKPTYESFFTGNYKTTVADLDKVEAAQAGLAKAEAEYARAEKSYILTETKAAAARTSAEERYIQVLAERAALQKELNRLTGLGGGSATRLLPQKTEAESQRVLKAIDPKTGLPYFSDKTALFAAYGTNQSLPGGYAPVQAALSQARGLDPVAQALNDNAKEQAKLVKAVQKADADVAKALAKRNAIVKGLRTKYASEFAALDSALNSTPPIAKDLDYFLQNSKSFRNRFTKQFQLPAYTAPAGPGANPTQAAAINAQREDFSKALIGKGITPESIKVSYDYEKGLYRLQGTIKGVSGAIGTWDTSIDKNMQLNERWGGSLRGSGGFLRQTSRDLQKVIEWTVATTVVFGSLGVAIGSISKINDINRDLAKYSITAKASAEETQAAFKGVSQIAYETATPLQDLTAVMDDIALATRRVTQTQEEWAAAQLALTRAVGIFTNLTGVDTVRATDLLSAAYKQLAIAPDQVVNVLSKVTAVAGGNAQAIEDIVQALGSVSEAAKASGLGIDEQIAAVQTLSQVTNKSASEVAVAFKNLFGSISSTGSVTALSKFGIAVKDSTGQLRPFLDIYKDISDAVASGKISQGQLQGVLKGISGGPRRAPDAAALLENINLIYENIGKSTNATNEALIANARVLDTNTAKLQQLRTAFDTAIVNQFTQSINRLVGTLVTLGQAAQGIFGTSNVGGFIDATTQLGLILVATLALSKGFSVLGRGIGGLRSDFSGLIKSEKSAATALAQFNNTRLYRQTAPNVPITQRNSVAIPFGANPLQVARGYGEFGVKKTLGTTAGRLGLGLAGGALAAGALGALGGGNAGSSLPLIGQGVGLTLATLGGPVAIAAGISLAALSTALQHFNDEQEKAAENSKKLRSAVFDNIGALGEERKTLTDAQKLQEDSKSTIDELSKKKHLNADETNRLTTAQQSYVDATFAVSDANKQILETTQKLIDQIPQLSDKFKSLGQAATSGLLSPNSLKDLSAGLAGDILQISGAGTTPHVPTLGPRATSVVVGRDQETKIAQATGIGKLAAPASSQEVVDAINKGGLAYVEKLLDHSKVGPGDNVFANKGFTVDSSVVEAIGKLIAAVPADQRTTDQFIAAVTAFGQFVDQVGTQQQLLATGIQSISATTQAKTSLGVLQGPEAQAASARASFASLLLPLLQNIGTSTGGGPVGEHAQVNRYGLSNVSNFLYGQNGSGGFLTNGQGQINTGKISADQARDAFAQVKNLNSAFSDLQKGTKEYDIAAYNTFKRLGYEVDGFGQAIIDASDDVKQLQEDIAASVLAGKQGLYQDLLNLRGQKLGGEFKGNEKGYAAETTQIHALIRAYGQLGEAFSSNTGAIDTLGSTLGKLHQFQGIQLTDTKDLLPTMINYAQTLGLTGGQITTFSKHVINLIGILNKLPANVVTQIKVGADISGMIIAFKAINAALKNIPKGYTGGPTGLSVAHQQLLDLGGLIAAQKELQAIGRATSGGQGSSFGKAPSSGGGSKNSGGSTANKPSLLDLPPEFKEGPRSVASLLKESVKNAKALQSKIPGETKANRKDIVDVLDGTKKVLQTRGIGEEYLRRAMDELTEQIKRQNDLLAKADVIRRIRIGGGDFSAIANLPVNSTSGISLGGQSGPINVTLNLNGTVLTPAQFSQFADQIAAALKKQLAA